MPLYEYDCKSCEKTVEILIRSREEQPECPECGETELHRQFSMPAAPNVRDRSALPVARPGESCGEPRCCGGGCQI